jgi:hypothetical protein
MNIFEIIPIKVIIAEFVFIYHIQPKTTSCFLGMTVVFKVKPINVNLVEYMKDKWLVFWDELNSKLFKLHSLKNRNLIFH